jgi:glutathione S-transferase
VNEADAQAPPDRRLYPDDPDAVAEVRALERDFDERLGPHSRRWIYNGLRGQRALAVAYVPTGVPAWERGVLVAGYPLLARVLDRYFDISPETAAESESEVRSVFDRVAAQLGDGRGYLCGDRFTAADLTFSALAAPMLVPPEYGVPLPQPDELPAPVAAVVRELRAHPAGAHAMAMFREHRR